MERSPFSQANLTPEILEKEAHEYVERIDQVKDVLEKHIDFKMVGDIISDIYRKCYPEISDTTIKKCLDAIYQPRIEVVYNVLPKEGSGMEYIDAITNGVSFKFSARSFFQNEEINTAHILHTAIHEAIHIASATYEGVSVGEYSETVRGFRRSVSLNQENEQDEKYTSFFDAFNEGMTEMLADVVYAEYLARNGEVASPLYEKVDEESGLKYGLADPPVTYENQRISVLALISDLASASGAEEEDIFRSLTAEYFTGGGLDRNDLLQYFRKGDDVYEWIEEFKRNHIRDYGEDGYDFVHNKLPSGVRSYVQALFGRDVVGRHNERVSVEREQ